MKLYYPQVGSVVVVLLDRTQNPQDSRKPQGEAESYEYLIKGYHSDHSSKNGNKQLIWSQIKVISKTYFIMDYN